MHQAGAHAHHGRIMLCSAAGIALFYVYIEHGHGQSVQHAFLVGAVEGGQQDWTMMKHMAGALLQINLQKNQSLLLIN